MAELRELFESMAIGAAKSALEKRRPRRYPWDKRDSIALIASSGGTGVILEFDGTGIEGDIETESSRRLDDHGLDNAPDGLSIWEGKLRVTSSRYDEDVDCELVGEFRELSRVEWGLLETSGVPWEKADHHPQCDVYDFDPEKQLGSNKPCDCEASTVTVLR